MKGGLSFCVLALFTIACLADAQESRNHYCSHKGSCELEAIHKDMFTHIGPPQFPSLKKPTTATFNVTYSGFTPQAQAAFQYAVDIWASLITSTVPINVKANWTALPPNVLGSAGAASVVRNFPGAKISNTWYSIALAEKLAGASLNSAFADDIVANFSSTFSNWYFGTDGNTPAGKYDFVTVVLHELGHGLGFSGSMSTDSSGVGSWGLSGFAIVYDLGAENGGGQLLTNTGAFPNPSSSLGAQLTGNSLYFDGVEANAAAGGTRPRLYAPTPWKQGSSFSHLDEGTYAAGNTNSLMTPGVGTAESIHSPGPITLGLFRDMGWETANLTSVRISTSTMPGEFDLRQNYPNPFNPSTTIDFTVSPAGEADGALHVSLIVFNVLGEVVATVVDEVLAAGRYSVRFDGGRLPSGMYFYQLREGSRVETKRMMLLK